LDKKLSWPWTTNNNFKKGDTMSTAITCFGKRAGEIVAAAKDEIQKARDDGWNVLISEEIRPASELFLPQISVIRLSPDPDAGDFYKPSDAKGKFRMHWQAKKKIGAEAGIDWVSGKEGIVKKDDDYVAFKAVGKRSTASGEPRELSGFGDIDMVIKEADIREGNKTAQYKKTEDKMSAEIRKERKFSMRKAESTARARVIDGFVPLKKAYTEAEIKKPFMILRYIFSPDMRDNFIKAQMLISATRAANGIYGGSPVAGALPEANQESIEVDYTVAPPEEIPIAEAENLADKPFSPAESLEADFIELGITDKVSSIKRMIVETKFDTDTRPNNLKKKADKYTADECLELYRLINKAKTDPGF
jgi:hypothetical protein